MSLTKSTLLFLYVLSVFLTGAFTISKGSGEGVSSASFQWHHLIFIIMFIYQTLLRKNDKGNSRIIIPSFWLLLFAVYSLFGVIAFIPRFGLQSLVLNSIYALSVVILFFSVYRYDDVNVIADVIGNAFICILIIIIVKDIVYAQSLISYFAHGGSGGHPAIQSYVGGGLNLEASLLGMYCVFTMNKKYGLAAWFASFIISCLYSSRTAFILNICVLLWYFAFVKRAFSNLNVKMLLVIVPVVFAVTYYVMTSSLGAVMINRFVKTGDEPGSRGRLRMWEHIGTVIEQYPLGTGVGNAIVAVRQLPQASGIAGNMHNIFFQYAMEQGVVGSAFLILGSWWLFRREWRRGFDDPFGVFMLLYLVQGLLQSRGVDAWMAVILGLYFVSRKKSP